MKKGIRVLILLFIMVFGITTTAYAETEAEELNITATASEGDVSVEIKTDKEEYETGDEIIVTVTVSNNGTEDLSDIVVELDFPEGIVDCEDVSSVTASLEAGNSFTIEKKATVIAKAENPVDNTVNNVFQGFKLIAIIGLVIVIIVVIWLLINKKNKAGKVGVIVLLITTAAFSIPMIAEAKEIVIEVSQSFGFVGTNGEVDVTARVSFVQYYMDETAKHVTVHDPSIVYDEETDMYYIFGSHKAWAKSEDMINWKTFANNITREYKTIFAEAAEWSANGGTQDNTAYDVSGNLWAPDVIYNETMGKWTMYMSVNGDNWYSSIVLLTADTPDGDWTYVGPVVYSGFTNKEEAQQTDFYDVYKGTDFPERYNQNRNGNHTYGVNAIDPCVFYDEDGRLWLAYGSWFGGIYLIELDTTTGLRLASHTYETIEDVSDEYQGIKIAGGQHVSGEAAYVEYVNGNYYLYVTLGGLTSTGGYNMRVFRADNPEGPYVDMTGDSAIYTVAGSNINGTVGVRVMSNYMWDYMEYGYVAQGHNSAYSDENGNLFLVYHTRFDNQAEGHQVRVHQQFINEDGWLVTAPFEYTGEALQEVDTSSVTGVYSVLYHKLSIDYANKECVTSETVEINEDGTITGAYKGTWSFSEKMGTPYVTMVIDDIEYKGVFVKQKLEDSIDFAITFTVLGSNEINIWGYKADITDEEMVSGAVEALSIPVGTFGDITLPAEGINATTISWTSSNEDILSSVGKVTCPKEDTIVTLTAKVSHGAVSKEKNFEVRVFAEYDKTTDKVVWEYKEPIDLYQAVQGTYQFANPFNVNNIPGIDTSNGVSIKFKLYRAGAANVFKNIMSFNTNAQGGLYIMDMAYLGYNADGGWFDANIKNANYVNSWQAGTNFIENTCEVEIRLLPTGFEYYVDGVLAYSQADIPYYTSTDLIADDASDKVPGVSQMSSYVNLLTYLNKTATAMNLGWGSWWDGGYDGYIANIELSVLGAPEVDYKGNYYLEEFVTGASVATDWISHEHGTLSVEHTDDHGYYLQYYVTGVSGNRGVYTVFDEVNQLKGNYTFEADIKLNSGYNRDTIFALLGADYDQIDYTGNKPTAETGYIFKMTVASETTTASITGSDKTVNIPADTWVHIIISVSEDGKVVAKIGKQTVETEVNGSGQLGGIFALCARSDGLFAIDNITINPN